MLIGTLILKQPIGFTPDADGVSAGNRAVLRSGTHRMGAWTGVVPSDAHKTRLLSPFPGGGPPI